jgi:uncharacterized phage-associated protein
MSFRWEGVEEFNQGFLTYERRLKQALIQVGQYWAAVLEADAKENAPWTDQTANARQSLHAYVEELSDDTIRIYLSGGVFYQVWLETKWQGKYAIIWPTIEKHLEEIRLMLQRIFGTRRAPSSSFNF